MRISPNLQAKQKLGQQRGADPQQEKKMLADAIEIEEAMRKHEIPHNVGARMVVNVGAGKPSKKGNPLPQSHFDPRYAIVL